MSEISVSLVWSFVFSFCEKLFELQAKYSDKIHQAVECLHKTSHVGSKFRFKTAQVASTFSQPLLCLFETKRKRKKKEKNKKKQAKVWRRFRVYTTVVRCLFSRISSLKGRRNVRKFKETANLYLQQTVDGFADSLKC